MTAADPRPAAIHAALEAARQRAGAGDFLGELSLYCEREACPARSITLTIQEDTEATPPRLKCPVCGRQLALHAARTRDEAAEADRREARSSVNAELYQARERRRLGRPDAIAPVPVGVLLDETLPEITGESR